jgi:T5orf172 domain
MAEIVYIITNETMPGLVKIGMTNADLAGRLRSLYQTGVPLPFELFYACEVSNAASVESRLHDAFGDHRISKSREFFRIAPERVKAALSLAAIREVTLSDSEIFETPEERTEVEVAKRRSRFTFSLIGLPVGSELQLERDPAITCRTVNEANKVEFLGSETSLSDAALQALSSIGYNWAGASGPWEWMYQGKRLDDLRREIEERTD